MALRLARLGGQENLVDRGRIVAGCIHRGIRPPENTAAAGKLRLRVLQPLRSRQVGEPRSLEAPRREGTAPAFSAHQFGGKSATAVGPAPNRATGRRAHPTATALRDCVGIGGGAREWRACPRHSSGVEGDPPGIPDPAEPQGHIAAASGQAPAVRGHKSSLATMALPVDRMAPRRLLCYRRRKGNYKGGAP